MTEAQARSVLTRCPSLGDLDVRLAQRRLRQLDRDMHISRWATSRELSSHGLRC